ncbi:TIP41-like protein [Penicillium pulvis]|uniref:TIP41-like protein n=1 Tax=Penicillium pulvis TaxID=1562058 RepID=UPI0025499A5C|nr:TIP41-like protein [Penicillium pulvis]KAJ5802263.1 TIP41-like protein [Penicillium pulvis]
MVGERTMHSRSAPSVPPTMHAAVYPTKRPQEISVQGFRISTQKLPILKADPIEEMTRKLGIAPPEMIFGDNYVMIEHEKSGWGINFNSFDALDRVDKTGQSMLQVAYSKEWQKSREKTHEGIKEVVKPFDWSYSTDYMGTLSPKAPSFEETSDPIPIELLTRPDPILFFDEVVLYEDELADNGIAMLSCKIRVMPERLLLLTRFFMRLDNVLIRLRDTRVYVDFATREVIREYQSKECEYEKVRQTLANTRGDIPALMRDANRLSEILPLVEKRSERVVLDG